MKRLALLMMLQATLGVPLFAQLTNQDDCQNAGVDIVGPGVFAFDNTQATSQAVGQSEQNCLAAGTTGISNDIWFTYTAVANATTTIMTCGFAPCDTRIAVWPGMPACPVNGTSLTCNDDACGLQSLVTFAATAGTSYIVQLGNYPGAGPCTGTVSISESGSVFPAAAGTDTQAGTCQGNGEIFGVTGGIVPVSFDQASVCMSRSAPGDSNSNGLRDVQLNVEVRIGAAFIPGVGNITIEMDGPVQPGLVEAQSAASDFPADMTLTLTKRFITPLGVFRGGVETYTGVIQSFPPYGVELSAPPGPVPLFDLNGVLVGNFYPDSIQPLFYIPGSNFPAGCGPIGTEYCSPAVPNSTGAPGVAFAQGSLLVTDNDITLHASQLPPNQFGYFITSLTQGFIANPAGSQGNLCVAGNIGRYNNSVGTGPNFRVPVDLASIPVNPPATAIPGDSWNFQCWYRDLNPGATSNFTNGITLTLQ